MLHHNGLSWPDDVHAHYTAKAPMIDATSRTQRLEACTDTGGRIYRGFFRYRKYAIAERRPFVLVHTAASGVTNGSHYQGISVRGCLAAAEERQHRARRP